MSNHLHLILSAKEENLSDVLRDFKKFNQNRSLEKLTKQLKAEGVGCYVFF